MTVPLLILALGSVVGGWVGLPPVLGRHLLGAEGGFLTPVFAGLHHVEGFAHQAHLSHATEWILMGVSTLVALVGFLAAYRLFLRPDAVRDQLEKPRSALYRLLEDKYRVDEAYDATIVRPVGGSARFLWHGIDELVIDLLVNFTGLCVRVSGEVLRLLQTGYVQTYAFFMVLGVLVILIRLLV